MGHGTGTAQLPDDTLRPQGEKTALKIEQKNHELIETRNNKVTIYSIKSADRNYQKNNGYLPVKRVFIEISYGIFF